MFKLILNETSRGRHKLKKLKSALENIKFFYESPEAVIYLFNDYSSIVSEAKYKSIYGEGLKILTPKQMLQRLPVALVRVKPGKTSGNVLNEIRQIIYPLYRGKEITKNVNNNKMNSIKL